MLRHGRLPTLETWISALLKGLSCKHLLEVNRKQRALLVCTLTLRTLHILSLDEFGLRFGEPRGVA